MIISQRQRKQQQKHNLQRPLSDTTPSLQPRDPNNKRQRKTTASTIQAPTHPSLQPLFDTVPQEFRHHPLGSFIDIRQWTYSNSDEEEEEKESPQQEQQELQEQKKQQQRQRNLMMKQQKALIEARNVGRSLQRVVTNRNNSTNNIDSRSTLTRPRALGDPGSNPTKPTADLQALLKRVDSLQAPSDSDWDSDPEEQYPVIRFQTWEKRKAKKQRVEKKVQDGSTLSIGRHEQGMVIPNSKEEEIMVLSKGGSPSCAAISKARVHQDPSDSAPMPGSDDILESLASSIKVVSIAAQDIDVPSSANETSHPSILAVTNPPSDPPATEVVSTMADAPSFETFSFSSPFSTSPTFPSTSTLPIVLTPKKIQHYAERMTRTPSAPAGLPTPPKSLDPTTALTIVAPTSKGSKSTSNSLSSSSRRSSLKLHVVSDNTIMLATGKRRKKESTGCKEGPAAVPVMEDIVKPLLGKFRSCFDESRDDFMRCVDVASAGVEDRRSIEDREKQNPSTKSRKRSSSPLPIGQSLGLLFGIGSHPSKGSIVIENSSRVKERSKSIRTADKLRVSDMDILLQVVDMYYAKALPLVRDHPDYMEWMRETIFSKYTQAMDQLFEKDQESIEDDTPIDNISVVRRDGNYIDWGWISGKFRALVRERERAHNPIKKLDGDEADSFYTAEKCSSCGGSGIQCSLKVGM